MFWHGYRPDEKLGEASNNSPDFAERHGLDYRQIIHICMARRWARANVVTGLFQSSEGVAWHGLGDLSVHRLDKLHDFVQTFVRLSIGLAPVIQEGSQYRKVLRENPGEIHRCWLGRAQASKIGDFKHQPQRNSYIPVVFLVVVHMVRHFDQTRLARAYGDAIHSGYGLHG